MWHRRRLAGNLERSNSRRQVNKDEGKEAGTTCKAARRVPESQGQNPALTVLYVPFLRLVDLCITGSRLERRKEGEEEDVPYSLGSESHTPHLKHQSQEAVRRPGKEQQSSPGSALNPTLIVQPKNLPQP